MRARPSACVPPRLRVCLVLPFSLFLSGFSLSPRLSRDHYCHSFRAVVESPAPIHADESNYFFIFLRNELHFDAVTVLSRSWATRGEMPAASEVGRRSVGNG